MGLGRGPGPGPGRGPWGWTEAGGPRQPPPSPASGWARSPDDPGWTRSPRPLSAPQRRAACTRQCPRGPSSPPARRVTALAPWGPGGRRGPLCMAVASVKESPPLLLRGYLRRTAELWVEGVNFYLGVDPRQGGMCSPVQVPGLRCRLCSCRSCQYDPLMDNGLCLVCRHPVHMHTPVTDRAAKAGPTSRQPTAAPTPPPTPCRGKELRSHGRGGVVSSTRRKGKLQKRGAGAPVPAATGISDETRPLGAAELGDSGRKRDGDDGGGFGGGDRVSDALAGAAGTSLSGQIGDGRGGDGGDDGPESGRSLSARRTRRGHRQGAAAMAGDSSSETDAASMGSGCRETFPVVSMTGGETGRQDVRRPGLRLPPVTVTRPPPVKPPPIVSVASRIRGLTERYNLKQSRETASKRNVSRERAAEEAAVSLGQRRVSVQFGEREFVGYFLPHDTLQAVYEWLEVAVVAAAVGGTEELPHRFSLGHAGRLFPLRPDTRDTPSHARAAPSQRARGHGRERLSGPRQGTAPPVPTSSTL
ncbi:uncharacterized protein LOC133348899 [Lethenteron reissneri]|uniref:uncharacterized protein LOC133348899 n=1 Tax=Lethenteron reissneri TaxID=7753 RepID=UPI002AB5E592|nr:uncharacterized protein LOC133348899 [Lethenteron reissneri]